MDCQPMNNNVFNAKFSPVTSVGTQSQIDQQIFIQQPPNLQQSDSPIIQSSIKVTNRFYLQSLSPSYTLRTKQQLFQLIEDQIMTYFKQKGVQPGNPGDFKKEFNKKLHKRVSLMVQVNQKVIQKANAGSSLLERRLHKKMTVSL